MTFGYRNVTKHNYCKILMTFQRESEVTKFLTLYEPLKNLRYVLRGFMFLFHF